MNSAKVAGIVKTAAAVVILLSVVGFGISSSRTMPGNAIVLLDQESKTYTAPPCVQDPSTLTPATASDARKLGFSPDARCRDSGAFLADDRSLTGQMLVTIGLLDELPSRWNPDGTWRW